MDSVTAYEQGLVQEGVDRFNREIEGGRTVTAALEIALIHVIRAVAEDMY